MDKPKEMTVHNLSFSGPYGRPLVACSYHANTSVVALGIGRDVVGNKSVTVTIPAECTAVGFRDYRGRQVRLINA